MIFEPSPEAEQPPVPAAASVTRWVFLIAFAVFASLAFLVVYALFLVPVDAMGTDHPAVGNSLKVLRVEPFVDAERAVTESDLKGRVTLINFWGPWCPPCRIEMPHLAEIEKQNRDRRQFQLLSVACGIWSYSNLEEMRLATERYRDQANLEFPIYYDPDFTSRTELESLLGKESQTLSYPTTVLIDQQGTIAGVWAGYAPSVPDQIKAAIERLLIEP